MREIPGNLVGILLAKSVFNYSYANGKEMRQN